MGAFKTLMSVFKSKHDGESSTSQDEQNASSAQRPGSNSSRQSGQNLVASRTSSPATTATPALPASARSTPNTTREGPISSTTRDTTAPSTTTETMGLDDIRLTGMSTMSSQQPSAQLHPIFSSSDAATPRISTHESSILDRPPAPSAVIKPVPRGIQEQPSRLSVGGLSGAPSDTLYLEAQSTFSSESGANALIIIQNCIDVAAGVAVSTRRVVTNQARCTRLAQHVSDAVPLLKALQQNLEKEEGTETGASFMQQLLAVRDVFVCCKACINRWTQAPNSRLKALANMFCSKQYDHEFVDLNLSLCRALNDLNLALQPLYDACSLQASDADSLCSSERDLKQQGAAHAHTGLSTNSVTPTASEFEEDTKSDLRLFVGMIVKDGGWAGLGAEDRQAISELYRSKGMDLVLLLSQAQSQARAAVVCNKLNDLEYIRWDDITGTGGPGTLLEYICLGGFGTLYKGKWQGEQVAVKKLEGVDTRKAQEDLAREAYIMSTCTHPNIARIFGIARETSTGIPAIVMKYYKKGSLLDVMHDCAQELTMVVKLRMARGVARGMAYLHGRPNEKITHGDLKPANILVDERMRVHISDFGVSSMKTTTRTIVSKSNARSVVYSAPEVLEGLLYTGMASPFKRTTGGDVYAFAMVLYELFTGHMPFTGANEAQVLALVANGKRPVIPMSGGDLSNPAAPLLVPIPVARIIECCWSQEPELRPSFSQVAVKLEEAAVALGLELDG